MQSEFTITAQIITTYRKQTQHELTANKISLY